MELSASIIPWVTLGATFMDINDCAIYRDELSKTTSLVSDTDKTEWCLSQNNILNRINGLDLPGIPRWIVDGCGAQGTQFFVRPVFSSRNVIPLRIDIFIPDQSKHPVKLRQNLRSSAAFYLRNSTVNQLGITEYILKVLDAWSSSFDFEETYQWLPFGSRIVIENIAFSVEKAKVRIIPNFSLEKQLLSTSELYNHRDYPRKLPPSVRLQDMNIVGQLHDSISLVQITVKSESKLYVFKSSTQQPRYIYHELENFLQLPAHDHIISAPSHIVLSETFQQNEEKVYGFLLDYHPKGNLASRLTKESGSNTITTAQQLKWSRQITSALIHIHESAIRYYSELKPDNVLLTASDDVLLIDLEQHANWETFSAPEIYHVDNMIKLLAIDNLPSERRESFSYLLDRRLHGRSNNGKLGFYHAWDCLDHAGQDAAMVYSLGKLMWCIFECCSHTVNTLKEEFIEPVPREFPDFHETHVSIQELIRRCTMGSPDWVRDDLGLARVGDKFYPKAQVVSGNLCEVSARDSMIAAEEISRRYLIEMEVHFEAMARWQSGIVTRSDTQILGFSERPKLKGVLDKIKTEEAICTN